MVNSDLIMERMKATGIDQTYISEKMKVAQSTLSLKINNHRAFTIEEMFKLSEILDIPGSDLHKFFLV